MIVEVNSLKPQPCHPGMFCGTTRSKYSHSPAPTLFKIDHITFLSLSSAWNWDAHLRKSGEPSHPAWYSK